MPAYTYSQSGTAPAAGTIAVGAVALKAVSANIKRYYVSFYNNGHAVVYLGSAAVTTANGWPLGPGATFHTQVSGDIYVVNSGVETGDLRYWDETKPT